MQITGDDLRVVDDVLQFDIAAVNRFQQAKSLGHIVQPVARHVDTAIDRLDQHHRIDGREAVGGELQVGNIGCLQFRLADARQPRTKGSPLGE